MVCKITYYLQLCSFSYFTFLSLFNCILYIYSLYICGKLPYALYNDTKTLRAIQYQNTSLTTRRFCQNTIWVDIFKVASSLLHLLGYSFDISHFWWILVAFMDFGIYYK